MILKLKYYLYLTILFVLGCVRSNKINKNHNITDCWTQGWLKYVLVDTTNFILPDDFLKNKYFYLQIEDNKDLNLTEKDKNIFTNIPHMDYFYFELIYDRINIYTARSGKYKHLKDTILLKDLIDQKPCRDFKGAVEDIGKFNEGNCFAIRYRNVLMLEACADTLVEKIEWINVILKQKEVPKNKEKSKILDEVFRSFKFSQKTTQPNSIFVYNHNIINRLRNHQNYSPKSINDDIQNPFKLNNQINQNQNMVGYLIEDFATNKDNLFIKTPPIPISTNLDTNINLNKLIREADHNIIAETSVQRIFGKKKI